MATLGKPASAAARMTRTAISPRLATSTLRMTTSPPGRAERAEIDRPNSGSLAMEADLISGSELGRVISRPIGQHADHRIATGHWMIGEEDQRLASRRDLDRAADQPLRRQFVPDPPVQWRTLEPDGHPISLG